MKDEGTDGEMMQMLIPVLWRQTLYASGVQRTDFRTQDGLRASHLSFKAAPADQTSIAVGG